MSRDKEQASRRAFDRWAGSFDRSRLLAAARSQAFGQLELQPGDRFLDVACGGGRLVVQAAPGISHAAGIDIAPGMLERARRRAAEEGVAADFRQGSAQQLPFEDASFTVIACTAALHHFPDPAAAVAEMARVIGPGGRVLLADLVTDVAPMRVIDLLLRRLEPGHVGFQHSRGLEGLLTGAGLTVTGTRLRFARTYALVRATKR